MKIQMTNSKAPFVSCLPLRQYIEAFVRDADGRIYFVKRRARDPRHTLAYPVYTDKTCSIEAMILPQGAAMQSIDPGHLGIEPRGIRLP